jgi:PhzF family phenazine biosynthesis protein
MANRRSLHGLRPFFAELAEALHARQLTGVLVSTFDVVEPGNLVHSRFFAPAHGVNEDPVTGSVHGPLAARLHQEGRLRGRARAEQGDAIGKPGRLQLEVTDGKVRVGGEAVTVLEGRLHAGKPPSTAP